MERGNSTLEIRLNGITAIHLCALSQRFHDFAWQDYTIDSSHPGQTAVQALQSDQLPGWQEHRHPGYTGYAWYRIQPKIFPNTQELALLMPQCEGEAYEVFVNGRKTGSFGKLGGWRVNGAVFAAIVIWGLVPFGLALGLLQPTVFVDHV